jgi:hypothetical protein
MSAVVDHAERSRATAPLAEPLLELRQLRVSYGKTAACTVLTCASSQARSWR